MTDFFFGRVRVCFVQHVCVRVYVYPDRRANEQIQKKRERKRNGWNILMLFGTADGRERARIRTKCSCSQRIKSGSTQMDEKKREQINKWVFFFLFLFIDYLLLLLLLLLSFYFRDTIKWIEHHLKFQKKIGFEKCDVSNCFVDIIKHLCVCKCNYLCESEYSCCCCA